MLTQRYTSAPPTFRHHRLTHLQIVITGESGVVMHSVGSVCVYVFVCPVRALAFESLDLETSFLVCRFILRRSRSSLSTRVISWGQGHASTSKQTHTHTSVCGLTSTERQSYQSLEFTMTLKLVWGLPIIYWKPLRQSWGDLR